jgi:hydroxymethylbilane synthase
MKAIRIGTRGSNLAIWQADFIERLLSKHHPGIALERVIIVTEGDSDQKTSLSVIGGQGVFTKTIEQALLEDRIDIAVHSLKDLPSKMTPGLTLAAVPQRGPVEDVLVTSDGRSFMDLEAGAKLATGSLRRKSQLLSQRTDVALTDLRGNIATRLHKLEGQDLAAIVMAKAAIVRLGLQDVRYQPFSIDEMLPAAGQGAVGLQIREEEGSLAEQVEPLNHRETLLAVTAERAMLHELDTGCQFPVGAFGTINQDKLILKGFVGSVDGQVILREQVESDPANAQEVGVELARKLIDRGAHNLLGGNTAFSGP